MHRRPTVAALRLTGERPARPICLQPARISEALGRFKAVAGQEKTSFCDRDRVESAFTFDAAVYNLMRLQKRNEVG